MGCSATRDVSPGGPGDPLRGLSVHYLRTHFVDDVRAAGHVVDARIYEIEENVIRAKGQDILCPRDARMGSAYVDAVNGEDNVGRATAMLSYTWGYTVKDIVDALSCYCEGHSLNPKGLSVWMCCLCINQHRVQEAKRKGKMVSFKKFEREFGSRVKSIKHILALVEPWHEPRYVTRVWCVFELYMATTRSDSCDVSFIMPPRETDSFMNALIGSGTGTDQLFNALARTQIQKAEATVPKDKDHIMKLIQDGPGFGRVNSEVSRQLQRWAVETATEQIKMRLTRGSPENLAKACSHVARMLREFGNLDQAQELLKIGLRKMLDLSPRVHAALLREEGIVKDLKGDMDAAFVAYDEAKRILKNANALETSFGADTLMSSGATLITCRQPSSALGDLSKAYRIYETTDTLQTRNGAALLKFIGKAHADLGDHKSALSSYLRALQIHESTSTLETPNGAALLADVGQMHAKEGEMDDALTSFARARSIRESTGTLETSGGAVLLLREGLAMEEVANTIGAYQSISQAHRVFDRIDRKTSGDKACLDHLHRLQRAIGKTHPRARARRSNWKPTGSNGSKGSKGSK